MNNEKTNIEKVDIVNRCVPGTVDRVACESSVFFFQAGDGIRGHCVTGVQTCALPIWLLAITPNRKI